MGERRWTDEQLSAIENRDKTLLVSAAAGSGKTATLTERIIRSLTDEKKPISIENLLSVTFTVAAAGELRAKLEKALAEAVAKNPDNEKLRRQLNMLPSAKIRTIDSFCNDILKMGADRVGLSRGYRIADTAECELLAVSILDGLIASVYRGERPDVASPEEFDELSDCLTDSKRVEELSEIMRLLYSRFESSEWGVDAMLPLIEKIDIEEGGSVKDTPHGEYLFELVDEFCGHYSRIAKRYSEILLSGSEADRLYGEMASSDVRSVSSLTGHKGYGDLRGAVLSFNLISKPRLKKGMEKSDHMLTYSDHRDGLREDFRKKILPYFSYSEQQWRECLLGLKKQLLVLYKFQRAFDKLFLEEKKRRAALSYSDVERLAYQCLIENGRRTDIAENLSRQFEAVYIDEYQDVNSLQNSIFEAISRPDNRFMVGDIKQSIYGFRSAKPEIFAGMKASLPPLSESRGQSASIFMSKNFRCDRGIVDFVNTVFDRTFAKIGDSIGYEEGDRLVCGKVYDGAEPEYRYPTVCVTDKPQTDGEDGGELSEAEVVAEKIREILAQGRLNDGAAPRPSDIAIIIRSARGKDVLYADALARLGIPSEISGAKSFFLSSEVLLALCLLNSIDNPGRDIYLAGAMCSPIFSFSADELCRIRMEGEGYTLYESLRSYCGKHPDYGRGAYFLERLDYYRTIAEGIGVDLLLSKLYRELGLMSLASHSGGGDNLIMLYDYARSYESGAYKGLYSFINFINSVIDKKTAFDDKRASGSSDAVRIITCHSSKGLEYPIVFLAGASSAFSRQDVRPRMIYSDELGISFRLRTPSGLALVENPVHDLTASYILRKQQEEELRVLYVALTRAREQLYVTGVSPSVDRDGYARKIELMKDGLSAYSLRNTRNYLDIILATVDTPPVYPEEFVPGYRRGETEKEIDSQKAKERGFELAADTEGDTESLCEELIRRFEYKYPNEHLTMLPEKISVSGAAPDMLDGDFALFDRDGGSFEKEAIRGDFGEGEEPVFKTFSEGAIEEKPCEIDGRTEDGKRYLPAFYTGRETEESAKRGIATHKFLQFCDLVRLKDGGAEAELERLVSKGYLSREDGERVRLWEIKRFTKSSLMQDMLGAKNLRRELRFNTLMPASIFTEDPQKKKKYEGHRVLVQGVIDCIVEYSDGSIGVFDYKTDRLRKEELENPALAEKTLRAKHAQQLSYYAIAVEKMFGKKPERVEVYSLPLGQTVDVKM